MADFGTWKDLQTVRRSTKHLSTAQPYAFENMVVNGSKDLGHFPFFQRDQASFWAVRRGRQSCKECRFTISAKDKNSFVLLVFER